MNTEFHRASPTPLIQNQAKAALHPYINQVIKKEDDQSDKERSIKLSSFSSFAYVTLDDLLTLITQHHERRISRRKHKLKVFLRVRNSPDSDANSEILKIDASKKQVTLNHPDLQRRGSNSSNKVFAFDSIFNYGDQQLKLCDHTATSILRHVLYGRDGCIFSFGAMASGKSYTIIGNDDKVENLGVIPYSLIWLYHAIEEERQRSGISYSVRISATEVYKNEVRDLLADKVADGKMNQSPGVYLTEDGNPLNVEEIRASSLQAALNLFDAANAAINCNQNPGKRQGSLMFIVYLYRYKEQQMTPANNGRSRLYFIDLAATDERQSRETSLISPIGRIILSLLSGGRIATNNRNKLIQVLREPLGNSKCYKTMIVNVFNHKENYFDALSTLNIASKILTVEKRKRIKGYASDAKKFEYENQRLKSAKSQNDIRKPRVTYAKSAFSGGEDEMSSFEERSDEEAPTITAIYLGCKNNSTNRNQQHQPRHIRKHHHQKTKSDRTTQSTDKLALLKYEPRREKSKTDLSRNDKKHNRKVTNPSNGKGYSFNNEKAIHDKHIDQNRKINYPIRRKDKNSHRTDFDNYADRHQRVRSMIECVDHSNSYVNINQLLTEEEEAAKAENDHFVRLKQRSQSHVALHQAHYCPDPANSNLFHSVSTSALATVETLYDDDAIRQNHNNLLVRDDDIEMDDGVEDDIEFMQDRHDEDKCHGDEMIENNCSPKMQTDYNPMIQQSPIVPVRSSSTNKGYKFTHHRSSNCDQGYSTRSSNTNATNGDNVGHDRTPSINRNRASPIEKLNDLISPVVQSNMSKQGHNQSVNKQGDHVQADNSNNGKFPPVKVGRGHSKGRNNRHSTNLEDIHHHQQHRHSDQQPPHSTSKGNRNVTFVKEETNRPSPNRNRMSYILDSEESEIANKRTIRTYTEKSEAAAAARNKGYTNTNHLCERALSQTSLTNNGDILKPYMRASMRRALVRGNNKPNKVNKEANRRKTIWDRFRGIFCLSSADHDQAATHATQTQGYVIPSNIIPPTVDHGEDKREILQPVNSNLSKKRMTASNLSLTCDYVRNYNCDNIIHPNLHHGRGRSNRSRTNTRNSRNSLSNVSSSSLADTPFISTDDGTSCTRGSSSHDEYRNRTRYSSCLNISDRKGSTNRGKLSRSYSTEWNDPRGLSRSCADFTRYR
ncbi:uncharacterized protein TRIADDRAFT_61389 [Trichoplax adhaerens]|uniref:Kinesin motor domain-containing protein n=1 Tax=Trichoplax adhaerens TaxID=10228 RepID=B3SAV1_TRIAD|nr:predicted protein [Trichoplax adhaerens]EDV20220.1 predicted protein [Trichoplax adhaerens]|eukprot:XP_002117381.1 predicted protein [Trichoplax adhaerens]